MVLKSVIHCVEIRILFLNAPLPEPTNLKNVFKSCFGEFHLYGALQATVGAGNVIGAAVRQSLRHPLLSSRVAVRKWRPAQGSSSGSIHGKKARRVPVLEHVSVLTHVPVLVLGSLFTRPPPHTPTYPHPPSEVPKKIQKGLYK